MRFRTGALVVLALAAAACGSASHRSHTLATQPASAPAASSATTATGPTSPTAATTLTAPPPIPKSVPAAPDGLRQTVGYSTYELCSQSCSGAVPASLRRPLRLPGPGPGGRCPLSSGTGPIRPQGNPTRLAIASFVGSAWEAGQVTWHASGYSGPVLIRGRELGGPHAVGFGEGHVPYDELQLLGPAMGAPPGTWPSFTRVRGPGCYAYQVDGTSFSEVIVFRAT